MAISKALYFVALVPPPAVKEEVLEMKKEIKNRFGAAHALKLPAHITLIPPFWLEQEQSFIDALGLTIQKIKSFSVELKDFGHFGQRVIFLNVEDHEPIRELHQILLKSMAEFLPGNKTSKIHPHITIATRDLTREKFSLVWEEFKNRPYQAQFKCTALTLFKHNGKTWDILEDYSFSGKEDF
ncbi:2'-5' RNA ligase family protein [Salinimicrobium terrae]|uniref:2'-5' RNA ligase family protein n=1 Tax=Salinimicrobium terrae TaxID=470866 RepID=UPI00040801AC|nr:2'-5' RNA ligase family protein [Salinimicrobium terrae]